MVPTVHRICIWIQKKAREDNTVLWVLSSSGETHMSLRAGQIALAENEEDRKSADSTSPGSSNLC